MYACEKQNINHSPFGESKMGQSVVMLPNKYHPSTLKLLTPRAIPISQV